MNIMNDALTSLDRVHKLDPFHLPLCLPKNYGRWVGTKPTSVLRLLVQDLYLLISVKYLNFLFLIYLGHVCVDRAYVSRLVTSDYTIGISFIGFFVFFYERL